MPMTNSLHTHVTLSFLLSGMEVNSLVLASFRDHNMASTFLKETSKSCAIGTILLSHGRKLELGLSPPQLDCPSPTLTSDPDQLSSFSSNLT